MKKLMVLLAMVLFVGFATSGWAENWKYIGSTSSARYWYDTDSIKKVDERIFRVWKKTEQTKMAKYELAKKLAAGAGGTKHRLLTATVNSAYTKDLIEINCLDKTWATLTSILYDKSGGELYRMDERSKDWSLRGKPFDISEGTANAEVYEKVCP